MIHKINKQKLLPEETINLILKFLSCFPNKFSQAAGSKKLIEIYKTIKSLNSSKVNESKLKSLCESAFALKASHYDSFESYCNQQLSKNTTSSGSKTLPLHSIHNDSESIISGIPNGESKDELKLFCLPYAGGNSFLFREWRNILNCKGVTVCPLEYPGRGTKISIPFASTLQDLCTSLFNEILEMKEKSFSIFGHSLGAIVGFELSIMVKEYYRKLKKKNTQHSLIVSGCVAPDKVKNFSEFQNISDDLLIKKLIDLNGIPQAMVSDPNFREFFLPIIKADFSLLKDYYPKPDCCIDVPVTAFCGESDPHTNSEDVERWKAWSSHTLSVHSVPGDHFFIHDRDSILSLIQQELLEICHV